MSSKCLFVTEDFRFVKCALQVIKISLKKTEHRVKFLRFCAVIGCDGGLAVSRLIVRGVELTCS